MPKNIIHTKIAIGLDRYANMLRYADLTYKQFKKCIKKKAKESQKNSINLYSFRCTICKNHRDSSLAIRCSGCQDLYHKTCIQIFNYEDDVDFLCKKCESELQIQLQKVQYVSKEEGDTLVILDIGNRNNICPVCYEKCCPESLQCYRCSYFMHKKCYGNTGSQFCQICDTYLQFVLPFNLETIETYVNQWKSKYTQKQDKYVIKPNQAKNTFTLIYPDFTQDADLQLQERYSLIKALCSKSFYFCDYLTYHPQDCNSILNNSTLEKDLQELDAENLKIFLKLKQSTSQGIFPQIMIYYHPKLVFILLIRDIQPNLQVQLKQDPSLLNIQVKQKQEKTLFLILMTELLRCSNTKKNLYVVPERYSNIARFVSGVNNKVPDVKINVSQQLELVNVACLRVSVNNQARIIMYAIRDIKPNQILYFDYNSGGQNLYPTNSFSIISTIQ